MNSADYAPGGTIYNDIADTQGTEAADAAYIADQNNLANQSYQTANPADVENQSAKSPGLGSLLKDLVTLSVIGGAIWLFMKLGGASEIKRVSGKGKQYFWLTVGAIALVAWLVYGRVKKTASDAQSTAEGITSGIKSLNPFS